MLTQRETFDVSYGGGKKTKTCVLPPVFFFGKNKISSLAYPCDPSAKPTRLASSVVALVPKSCRSCSFAFVALPSSRLLLWRAGEECVCGFGRERREGGEEEKG